MVSSRHQNVVSLLALIFITKLMKYRIFSRCRDKCKNGFYGQNCSKQCRCQNGGQCNFLDGTCTCLPGYFGNHCEHRCAKGFYGVNCSAQCRCMKEHVEHCDPVDGSCVCLHGYIGMIFRFVYPV